MPELPEVETLKNQLSGLLIGQKIKNIEIISPKSFIGDKRQVIDEKIIEVRRFAKLLVVSLSSGKYLAIHLKLTGQLIYRGKRQPKNLRISDPDLLRLPNKYTRVIIGLVSGDMIYFNDQRIFGWIKVLSNNRQQITDNKLNTLENLIKKLGPDPLKDLTSEKFKKILESSRKPIKVLLMDQEKISGVGNIYANDALFLAGIHPKTPSNQLSKVKSESLYLKLLKVLREGIKWRGSSQDNFRDAFGVRGEKQMHFYVYGRTGEECVNKCGGIIKRIALGGRGTFFCPICQSLS